jgi:hypothetical protein
MIYILENTSAFGNDDTAADVLEVYVFSISEIKDSKR